MKAPFLREYYPYEFAHGRPYRMYFCKEVSDQMKAVIMAGGEGSRLRPLTCDLPKPMARLCGRPIFEYILDLLLQNDFDEAAVTLRYLPNAITRRFGYGRQNRAVPGNEPDLCGRGTALGHGGRRKKCGQRH